jgi:hypothetical protein
MDGHICNPAYWKTAGKDKEKFLTDTGRAPGWEVSQRRPYEPQALAKSLQDTGSTALGQGFKGPALFTKRNARNALQVSQGPLGTSEAIAKNVLLLGTFKWYYSTGLRNDFRKRKRNFFALFVTFRYIEITL